MNYLFVMPKGAAKSSGGYNVFPVGIAYVSAYFRKHSDNDVTTANLEFHGDSTHDALSNLIKKNNIDVICTSGLSRDYPKVKEVIDTAREINPSIITVVGGGIISSDPEPAMLALGADFGVIGEGEITLCELADALNNNRSCDGIPGLIFKKSDRYLVTPARAEIDDIDSIPLPDYDGFSFSEYMASINHEAAYVVASRSCPFSCTFCFHPSGKKYRQRSLENLFEEIDYLLTNYKVGHLVVSDELFAHDKSRVHDFCDLIAKYNVRWTIQLRVCDVNPDLLGKMKQSGCYSVSYGLESADDSVLKSMKKHITAEQINSALQMTYDADLDIQGGFIFGDAAETTDTAARTLEWNAAHSHYALELNMIHIFPGTPLYNHAFEKGIIKDKVQYLIDGCPLINVSQLTDSEYRNLSSRLYEKNMRSRYSPFKYDISNTDSAGNCLIHYRCNKCETEHSIASDMLHIKRTTCGNCEQRYYLDPFHKLHHQPAELLKMMENESHVALWGAGEICIKLLDKYDELKNEMYKVVDISKSRQGYSVCDKFIYSPEIIKSLSIKTVVICVVQRMSEVLACLKTGFPSVTRVYAPKTGADTTLYLDAIFQKSSENTETNPLSFYEKPRRSVGEHPAYQQV